MGEGRVINKEVLFFAKQTVNEALRAYLPVAEPSRLASVVNLENPTLIANALGRSKDFFKTYIDGPPSSVIRHLAEARKAAEKLGFTDYKLFILPNMRLTRDSKIWKKEGIVKVGKLLDGVSCGDFPERTIEIDQGAYLMDMRIKPDFDEGRQKYPQDQVMEKLIEELKSANNQQSPFETRHTFVSDGSRFGLTGREIEEIVMPRLSEMLGAEVTLPRLIEFNIIGNMGNPQLGTGSTLEWFGPDLPGGEWQLRFIGGSSEYGGLASCHLVTRSLVFFNNVGFRPMIRFPY